MTSIMTGIIDKLDRHYACVRNCLPRRMYENYLQSPGKLKSDLKITSLPVCFNSGWLFNNLPNNELFKTVRNRIIKS